MDHDDRGLCLITHADVEDLHWARPVFWQRGLPSEELAANLPLFGRAHYSVSQRCYSRRADLFVSTLNHRMAQRGFARGWLAEIYAPLGVQESKWLRLLHQKRKWDALCPMSAHPRKRISGSRAVMPALGHVRK